MTPARAFALAAVLLLAACQRKAPGPAECERFALRVVGVSDTRARVSPSMKRAIDELTVTCLTRPFSRALLRCVEEGTPARHCMASYPPRREMSRPTPTERVFEPEF